MPSQRRPSAVEYFPQSTHPTVSGLSGKASERHLECIVHITGCYNVILNKVAFQYMVILIMMPYSTLHLKKTVNLLFILLEIVV